MTENTILEWNREFDELMDLIGPRYARSEARNHAARYMKGLMSDTQRKNGWQLAETLGDKTPYGLQQFLYRSKWDPDAVRDDLRHYVITEKADPAGLLIVDETGFLKKGNKSVGVGQQYCGTAQVPEEVGFATKPMLALTMLQRAVEAGVPAQWVAADSVYGSGAQIRHYLESLPLGYVLGISSKDSLLNTDGFPSEKTLPFPYPDIPGRFQTQAWPYLPLTVPEIRHLLWHLCLARTAHTHLTLHWSRWRRHHQAVARVYHVIRRQGWA